MTTKEMIEVMQAYDRGEQIERREIGEDNWYLFQVPSWDLIQYEYRIKPKPAYRPYKNIQEFLKAQKEHGMNIRLNGRNYCRLPLYITDTLIGVQCPQSNDSVISINIPYEDLLQGYTWQDGTPCGIEE